MAAERVSKTTIYGVCGDGWESTDYFPTKAAALREARRWARVGDKQDVFTVTACTLAPAPVRAMACALLNRKGSFSEQKLIATFSGLDKPGFVTAGDRS